VTARKTVQVIPDKPTFKITRKELIDRLRYRTVEDIVAYLERSGLLTGVWGLGKGKSPQIDYEAVKTPVLAFQQAPGTGEVVRREDHHAYLLQRVDKAGVWHTVTSHESQEWAERYQHPEERVVRRVLSIEERVVTPAKKKATQSKKWSNTK
jgi:hypothetical protein